MRRSEELCLFCCDIVINNDFAQLRNRRSLMLRIGARSKNAPHHIAPSGSVIIRPRRALPTNADLSSRVAACQCATRAGSAAR